MSRRDIAKVRMNLGLLTRLERERKNLKRRKVANETQVEFETICVIEHGYVWQHKEDYTRLIKFYGMSEEVERVAFQLLEICFSAESHESDVSDLIPSNVLGVLIEKTKPNNWSRPKPRRPHFRALPRKTNHRQSSRSTYR